ncbi:cupredoxin domain-containing protein [Streptomyces sp. JV176]|uniref:cupredoxin domain-containing protein n=1 Tax=Streptomyces sp. JV176 TaxID=858630 RepID=UPI002E75DD4A|nr:cupredoxin domain-containing protein [Streptomyces sp. JV176]MEE1800833.1 cupredoxin domain-containing protein [Streptomyces sp. JV176]
MPFPGAGRRPHPAVALAAVLVTTLAGCSGGGGGGTSSASPSPSASAGGSARVTIDNFTFAPAALTVAPGTEVTVVNKDSVAHTLTATTGKAFDTGTIGPGKTATFTAPGKAGAYPYTCTIHPFMKGKLTVR